MQSLSVSGLLFLCLHFTMNPLAVSLCLNPFLFQVSYFYTDAENNTDASRIVLIPFCFRSLISYDLPTDGLQEGIES